MSSTKREARNLVEVAPNTPGAEVRRLREAAGLSQAELAELMGIKQSQMSVWELSKRTLQEDNVLHLARVLGVKPGSLLEVTQWGGAIVVGSERRKRLQQLWEEDWQILDPVVDAISDATTEERATLAQDLRVCLASWEARRQVSEKSMPAGV